MKLPVERLVFIDEFAVNTAMTRTHARAPRGERAEVSEPGHHGPNISVLSALSLSGVSAMMTIEGAVDTCFPLPLHQGLTMSSGKVKFAGDEQT
jgi:hypothetical protein